MVYYRPFPDDNNSLDQAGNSMTESTLIKLYRYRCDIDLSVLRT